VQLRGMHRLARRARVKGQRQRTVSSTFPQLPLQYGLPKSRGGADHPLNYRMIDSSLNRSLGNDVMAKLMVHPLHVLKGALASAFMRLRCSPHL
jgi:hypothetical protein